MGGEIETLQGARLTYVWYDTDGHQGQTKIIVKASEHFFIKDRIWDLIPRAGGRLLGYM